MVMFRLRIMFHRSTFSAAINQNFDPHKLDCFRKKKRKNCTRAGIVINLFVKFFFPTSILFSRLFRFVV